MATEQNNKPNIVILNQTNALSMVMKSYTPEKKLLMNGSLWHKIIVHNVGNLDREFVLKTLLNVVHPHDLIPVNYKVEGANAHFMARNCGGAIEKLCRDNLVAKSENGQTFILTVILGFSNTTETQLNVHSNIKETVKKRFNTSTKMLNLDSFHKDTELSELIFCILSQPKIMYFVLQLSKSFTFNGLKLSNNELRILSPLETIWTCKTLTSLDLRNNLIENMISLSVLKNMHITELWLDGNPVCNNYNELGYIQAVKEVCPHLEKLDGVVLGTNGFLAYRRNYAVDHNCQPFVHQFLQHYFMLYDSGNRRNLDGLYHENAIFSLSCSYLPGQSSSTTLAKFENYKKLSRNLIKLSDLSKSSEQLMCGSADIVKRLCELPPTEHDPYTFTVDVVCYNINTVILIVTGAFRELVSTLKDAEGLYGFSRTFILAGGENGEFNIVNETLHITNATISLANRAFKVVKQTSHLPTHQQLICAQDPLEKKNMVDALSKITTLNTNWARKCLEDSKWNFKKALEVFIDLYKLQKIPQEAFAA